MEILSANKTFGVIGGGCMARCILCPLFDKGLIQPGNVIVSATSEKTLKRWATLGCRTTLKNDQIVEASQILMWAVKPQIFPVVVEEICRNSNVVIKPETLNITIMAGIALEHFNNQMKHIFQGRGNFRTIRIMPNIGLEVSCGVCVFTGDTFAKDEDKTLIKNMFQPIGLCYEVQESQINAYCGLFGSGIGFMFPIMEALSDGAVKVGIPRQISLEIAAQVLKGAGELYLKNRMHPGEFKDMVCSPGGTTIAGISELEKGAVRSSIINAIQAATTRGQELGVLAKSNTKM